MRRYLFLPAIIVMLFGCNQPFAKKTLADSLHTADTSLKTLAPARIIVPGKSIGAIFINENTDSVAQQLGKPDSGDAAMGASLMMWLSKHDKAVYKTTIYAHKNMGAADEMVARIKQIRVTSPYYKTADYAGAGSELRDVRKVYKLKRHPLPGSKKMCLYDDYGAGIGFEVDSTGRCTAVRVFARGDSSGTYIDMR